MSKKQHSTPSITVDASFKQDRKPLWIDVDVEIGGSGSDRVSAYSAFDGQLQKFKAVVDSLNDLVLESKVETPRESSDEVDKTFKKVEIIHVRTTATIRIGTSSSMGATLTALVGGGFNFSQPQFVYPEVPEIQPEQLELTAASARQKAEACARGAGCRLGNVLSINFPKAKEFMDWKPLSKAFGVESLMTVTNYLKIDDFEPKIQTYEDEFSVTITYQLVSE